ncbi:hypothetical protein F441_13914 [Phytophthora nicotianae CJ01A1]|uniref:Uncharacterized protein n=4 Tax=Phytophthora nicotianae TaxID=4792 RepID=W2PX29_PHYN3|nr:hypothetical protein PPTG_23512 [Phytophthora nicotianae INRA-310]ETK80799.1 hypothetical protein L915_13621 [Phytophthora nicotianae]ETP10466.1 hypothetical protein F441_13914 [Phytophthora nicotianae CJ01A1]ETP38638.1 hypothetical protein F442_13823 [Phytophthora nicotianae P10297]ETL34216.1 hypothetical protein L916_13519 [Phytophthora nicotianae]ETL87497.1 hypothetical protein L917_13330 [Phytophthora nicotianae]
MTSEIDDFSVVKSSVLAFLTEYEIANRAYVIPAITTDAPSPPSNSLSSEQLEVRKKRTWRQRQQQEVYHARQIIKRLSARLQELKNKVKVSAKTNRLKGKRQSIKTSGVQMWKRIAERQFLLRQTSEVENIKLRKAVRSQIRQATSFQRALRKRLPEGAVASLANLIKPV